MYPEPEQCIRAGISVFLFLIANLDSIPLGRPTTTVDFLSQIISANNRALDTSRVPAPVKLRALPASTICSAIPRARKLWARKTGDGAPLLHHRTIVADDRPEIYFCVSI